MSKRSRSSPAQQGTQREGQAQQQKHPAGSNAISVPERLPPSEVEKVEREIIAAIRKAGGIKASFDARSDCEFFRIFTPNGDIHCIPKRRSIWVGTSRENGEMVKIADRLWHVLIEIRAI